MAVTLNVEPYPLSGTVTGFVAEEWTAYGWAEVLDTATVAGSYSVTPTSDSFKFRVRWEVDGQATAWKSPTSVSRVPSASQEAAIKAALIQKAVRVLTMRPHGQFGTGADLTFMNRPDYETQELLYGLRFENWDIDLTDLVTTDDVIRVGQDQEPGDFPDVGLEEVQRAIDAAGSWVAAYLLGGMNFA